MSGTTSPILGIAQVNATQSGKTVTINNAVSALEAAFNATFYANYASTTAITLSALQLASYFCFVVYNNASSAVTLTVPLTTPSGNTQSRTFAVRNAGSTTITVGGATGTTAAILPGGQGICFCDGTDVYLIAYVTPSGASVVTSIAGLSGVVSGASLASAAGLALLASPAFTGTPSLPPGATATTQSAGTNNTSLATTAFVEQALSSVASGLDVKNHVRALSPSNVVLTSAPSTIDGVTLVANDRVLLTGQSTGSQNGIYVFSSAGSALTRSTDANTSGLMAPGSYCWVTEGTTYADTGWIMITTGTITLETTSLSWTQFSGAAEIVAGTALSKSGNTLNVALGTSGSSAAAGNDSRITGAEQTANKGAANGYAPLNSSGVVPSTYLPTGLGGSVTYQGTWNASTNSPTLTSSTGTKGYYYTITAATTSTALDGISTWNVGDHAVFNGSTWERWIGQIPFGTAAGTVAQGNDSRITGAVQSSAANVANGYAALNSSAQLSSSVLPPQPYDIPICSVGVPASGQILTRLVMARPVTFPSGLSTSPTPVCLVAPTGAVSIPITKNGTSIGSVNFASGSTTGTFAFSAAVTTSAGDILQIVMSGTDATFSTPSITLTGTR